MQFANPTNIRIIFHIDSILQMKGYTKLMNGHNYGTDRELLTSGNSISRVLDQFVIGGKFRLRKREETLVMRERLTCVRVSALVWPKIV